MAEKQKTILLAEDDDSILEVMGIILEGEGYRVVKAKDHAAVASELQRISPDLLFLDINLGGDNGEDIAYDLKQQKKTAAIPLVLLSADDKTKEIAARVKADGFLLKPFDIDILLDTVRSHIS